MRDNLKKRLKSKGGSNVDPPMTKSLIGEVTGFWKATNSVFAGKLWVYGGGTESVENIVICPTWVDRKEQSNSSSHVWTSLLNNYITIL